MWQVHRTGMKSLVMIRMVRGKNNNAGGRKKLLLCARSAQVSHQAAATMLGFTDKIKSMKPLTKISNIGNTIYFAAAGRQNLEN